MPTPIEVQVLANHAGRSRANRTRTTWLVVLLLIFCGCGEPSLQELENRRELEALLTAISLKNQKELDRDIKRVDDRHDSGKLSDESYKDLQKIVKKAQAGDWAEAEKQAYELRESKPYFQ